MTSPGDRQCPPAAAGDLEGPAAADAAAAAAERAAEEPAGLFGRREAVWHPTRGLVVVGGAGEGRDPETHTQFGYSNVTLADVVQVCLCVCECVKVCVSVCVRARVRLCVCKSA